MASKSRQRFRSERTGIGGPLGEVETAEMRHVWGYGKNGCLAAEVYQALDLESPLALTTVLTTLDRLNDKGIVRREREGKAYRYRATVSEQALEQRIVNGVLDSLIARFPKAVATYFSDAGGESTNLSELARRVEELQRRKEEENDV